MELQQHVPKVAATLLDKTKFVAARARGSLLIFVRPLANRFRALFTLRNIGGKEAIDAIARCFDDDSALFKHECAYCLGQMQDAHAISSLIEVLEDEHQDVMVRHEAGEALGAIADPSAIEVLKKHAKSEIPAIRETCEIALDLIDWHSKHKQQTDNSTFQSVDPAPPSNQKSIPELETILLDTSKSLFERYRALFALRNINNKEATLAIVEGFKDASELFRHEIAYVLGQLQHPAAVPALIERLQDEKEHYMVRHESAEALGSIATDECLPILKEFADVNEQVVRESCEVALDMHEYENSGQFQYADGILAAEH